MVSHGPARQGGESLGKARNGRRGLVSSGVLRWGRVWQDMAGRVRQCGERLVQEGKECLGAEKKSKNREVERMVYKIEERYEWRGTQYPVEPQVAGTTIPILRLRVNLE